MGNNTQTEHTKALKMAMRRWCKAARRAAQLPATAEIGMLQSWCQRGRVALLQEEETSHGSPGGTSPHRVGRRSSRGGGNLSGGRDLSRWILEARRLSDGWLQEESDNTDDTQKELEQERTHKAASQQSLCGLSNEYTATAETLEKKIALLTARKTLARGQEALILEKRLIRLRQEYYETCRIAAYLSSYYNADQKRRGWGFL